MLFLYVILNIAKVTGRFLTGLAKRLPEYLYMFQINKTMKTVEFLWFYDA